MGYNTFGQMWDARRKLIADTQAHGRCVIQFRVSGKFTVICPKHEEWDKWAWEVGGRYRPRTKTWTFLARYKEPVIEMCNRLWAGKVKVMTPKPVKVVM